MEARTGRETRILGALLGAWFLARLTVVWSGWPETTVVADDAYYYFTIARNLARGLGPTFDGLSPTNGFHPLWQILLVPLFRLFASDLWTPVRAALTLSSLFDLLSALLVYRCLVRLATPRRALVGVALWLFSPFTFLLALRGMEASVSTLLVLVVFGLLCPRAGEPLSPRPGRAVAIGLALGACGLARTDNLPAVGAALLVASWWGPGRSWATRARLRWLSLCTAVVALVTAPWFLWNLRRFGSVLQVSGKVKFLARDHFYGSLPWGWDSVPQAVSTVVPMTLSPLLSPLRFVGGREFGSPLPPVPVAVAMAFLLVGLLRARRGKLFGELGRAPVFLLGYLGAHVLLFGFLWRTYASWYALPSFAALTILAAHSAPWPPPRAWWRCGRCGCGVSLIGLQIALWIFALTWIPHGARGPERRFEPLFRRVVEELPPGVVLGAFDAGALGYVGGAYGGFVVTNLDCLVNNAAFEALQHDRYRQYVLENVDYLLQDAGRARMFLPPEEVEELRRHYRRRADPH
jgi:hypothetical protein